MLLSGLTHCYRLSLCTVICTGLPALTGAILLVGCEPGRVVCALVHAAPYSARVTEHIGANADMQLLEGGGSWEGDSWRHSTPSNATPAASATRADSHANKPGCVTYPPHHVDPAAEAVSHERRSTASEWLTLNFHSHNHCKTSQLHPRLHALTIQAMLLRGVQRVCQTM